MQAAEATLTVRSGIPRACRRLSPWPSSPPSPRGREPLWDAGAALGAGTPTPALPSWVEEPANTSASAPWEAAAVLERDRHGHGGGFCLSTRGGAGVGSPIRGAGGGGRALALQNTSLGPEKVSSVHTQELVGKE